MGPKKNRLTRKKNARDAFNKERAEKRKAAKEGKGSDPEENVPDPGAGGEGAHREEANHGHDKETQTELEVASVGVQSHKPDLEDKGVQAIQLLPVRICRAVQTDVESTYATQTHCSDYQICVSTSMQNMCDFLKCSLSQEWTVSLKGSDHLLLAMMYVQDDSLLIKKGIVIMNEHIQITVHGHQLLNNHRISHTVQTWKESCEEINATKVNNLALDVEKLKVCSGIGLYSELWNQGMFAMRGTVENGYAPSPVYRPKRCDLLLGQSEKSACVKCRFEQSNMLREMNRRKRAAELGKELKYKNIKFMPKHELEVALKESRRSDSKHKRQVIELRKRIDKLIEKGESISKGWSEELKNVNKKNFDKMTPLQQLFWDQQLKVASLKRKSSVRWHPMMIRLAISFQKSASVDKLRQHDVLFLPSNRTLFDYTHYIKPKEGVQEHFIEDISKNLDTKCKEQHERYVLLMFDEMHVRANLVYSKSSGELVGYAKLNELETEFKNLQAEWSGVVKPKEPPIADKVLVFMVKTITTNHRDRSVKGLVGVFSVPSSMPAGSLFTRLWEVIYAVESAGIPIICVTCDGASTNRACINMHPKYKLGRNEMDEDEIYMGMYEDNEPVFCTTNMASPDLRPLFFVIDPPHLLKTLRNAFANSYCHKKSRRLWNLETIEWTLVRDYFEKNKGNKFRKSQISSAHVYLTGFSVMKVSYAAQVMSNRLSKAIEDDCEQCGSNKPFRAAVSFMKKTNDLFDCLNGHNITSGARYRNENLKPYSKISDDRFKTVMFEYLDYVCNWKEAVLARQGNFSKKERKAMMLPDQSSSALRVTVFGMRGAIKYLLAAGATQICARRFCQDPLEQTFSTLRSKGGSNNSLDLQEVLQATVSLHAQGQAAIPSLRGNTSVEKEDIVIDSTPLPKRKQPRLE